MLYCLHRKRGSPLYWASSNCAGLQHLWPHCFWLRWQVPCHQQGGITAWLWGQTSSFYIDATYLPGTPIVSSASIASQTLASLGFITKILLGTWTLLPADGLDPYAANDTIRVVIGLSPPPTVPGPLPLLGVGAAMGFSRRLRCRRRHGCMDLRQRSQSQD